MKRLVITMLALLLFAVPAFGARKYYYIDIVDEHGHIKTDATQIEVQTTAGVAVAVYAWSSGSTEVGSTGVITTGIDDGTVTFWYDALACDLMVTDGTNLREIESFSFGTHRFMLPGFLGTILGVGEEGVYEQGEDLDFEYASWVIDGDTTNRLDMIPDNDGAVFAIGDGTYQADIYFYSSSTDYIFFDEGNKILEMVDVDIDLDDASVLTLGSGNDFEIYSDTDGILEFDPATAGNSIYFGTSDTDAVVIKWFTDVSGNYVTFNEENDKVYFTDVDLQLDDDTKLLFGSLDYDFAIYRSAANTLSFDPSTTGNEIKFGTAYDDAVDLTWYGDLTGDTVAFDEENCEVLFTDIDIQLDDAADLIVGTDNDWVFECDQDGILEIIPDAIGNEVRFGSSHADAVIVTWYSDTSGDTVVFDEENVMVEFEDVSIALGDATKILFGDTIGTGDFSISSTSAVLYIAQVVADTGTMEIGAAGTDIPLTWHAETSGAEVLFTADTVIVDGVDITINDDDILNFGDSSEIIVQYDEDGDDDLQVKGPVDFETTYCLFGSNPVGSKITGSAGGAVGGTTGDENAMAVDGTNFEYHILGAGQTITAPSITANGLDLRLDAIDDEGMELGEGITARSKSAFTIGTDAFYLKVKVYVTDVNDFDILACGFRLAEAYQSDIYAYNTYAGINVNNGVVNGIDELNGASAHETDMEEDMRDGVAFTMEVRIDAAKAVTQYIDGTAVTTPLAFSWTDTDTVVPFFHILGDASAAGEVAIQLWECGLQ